MSIFDSIAYVRRDLACLRPHEVKARVLELTRGGHRSSSFSTGRGGEPASPAFDQTDLEIQGLWKDIEFQLQVAAKAVAKALADQDKVLAKARIKKLVDGDEPADEVWCRSCSRVAAFNPRGNPKRQGLDTVLCSWCFDNQGEEMEATDDGRMVKVFTWPDLAIVKLHGEGTRITSKALKEAGVVV